MYQSTSYCNCETRRPRYHALHPSAIFSTHRQNHVDRILSSGFFGCQETCFLMLHQNGNIYHATRIYYYCFSRNNILKRTETKIPNYNFLDFDIKIIYNLTICESSPAVHVLELHNYHVYRHICLQPPSSEQCTCVNAIC